MRAAVIDHWDSLPEADGAPLCISVMPDHVHVVLRLGQRLTIGQIVGRFKAKNPVPSGGWQRDFFEHRFRSGDRFGQYAKYLFMNPYRAGLIGVNQTWPGWRIWDTAGTIFDLKPEPWLNLVTDWLRQDRGLPPWQDART
jgi:hypothetical protein